MSNSLHRPLFFDTVTFVVWRAPDGALLHRIVFTPHMRMSVLLADYAGPYDVFAWDERDWRLICEVRPQTAGPIVDWKAP